MKITKGTLLSVNHNRKGKFIGIAISDFDTEIDIFYPIALAENKILRGTSIARSLIDPWVKGDEIPCRNTLCTIEIFNPTTK